MGTDSSILSRQAQTYAEFYGRHEAAHVDLLTKTINQLGGTPVQEQQSYRFPDLSSEQQTIELLVTVEDLGAAAYLGAASMLMENDELLTTAVRIHLRAWGWLLGRARLIVLRQSHWVFRRDLGH